MRSLQVAHFATLTRWGGVERMLVDLLQHVSQEQVHHSLITTSSSAELIEAVQKSGIVQFQPAGRFRYNPMKFRQIAGWMRAHKIRVVHSYNAFANAWANISVGLAGVPVFVTGEHGTIWRARPPLAWLDRLAHQRAKCVIANSHAAAKLLEIRYRIPADKIRVVLNGIPDIPQVDKGQMRGMLGVSPDTFVIGSVGRLDTPKDYATLVETAALVLNERQDVVFVLIGGGPLEDELRSYVEELGIERNFRITGWRSDARSLMQGFDLFVSTSIRESFGNVLVEAALCGKPVIAPAIDGIPSAVIHEETGLLLKPTLPIRKNRSPEAAAPPTHVFINNQLQAPQALDPQLLAQTILRVIANPEWCAQIGQQARERAKRLFSIERYVRDLEETYLESALDGGLL